MINQVAFLFLHSLYRNPWRVILDLDLQLMEWLHMKKPQILKNVYWQIKCSQGMLVSYLFRSHFETKIIKIECEFFHEVSTILLKFMDLLFSHYFL